MDRRNFLSMAAMGLVGFPGNLFPRRELNIFAKAALEDRLVEAGWLDYPRARVAWKRKRRRPYLHQFDEEIRGTGAGKQAFLWKFMESVTGYPLRPHKQQVGSCVGEAYALGVDILTATQIKFRHSPQRWIAKSAVEIIYAGSRVEIGRDEYGYNFGRYDGSLGVFAADFVNHYGVLLRQEYLGVHDFTTPSGRKCRELGYKGVPDALEPLCRLHPVGRVALVMSWEEARDCVYNGYPVVLCSNQGFQVKPGRDKDGFLPPSRYSWNHAMLLEGIDDSPQRPGGLIQNSWGDFVGGPTRHGQPVGSFWADAEVIDRMCKQQDTVALSCYAGYPQQDYFIF